jgi:hypothetical protein
MSGNLIVNTSNTNQQDLVDETIMDQDQTTGSTSDPLSTPLNDRQEQKQENECTITEPRPGPSRQDTIRVTKDGSTKPAVVKTREQQDTAVKKAEKSSPTKSDSDMKSVVKTFRNKVIRVILKHSAPCDYGLLHLQLNMSVNEAKNKELHARMNFTDFKSDIECLVSDYMMYHFQSSFLQKFISVYSQMNRKYLVEELEKMQDELARKYWQFALSFPSSFTDIGSSSSGRAGTFNNSSLFPYHSGSSTRNRYSGFQPCGMTSTDEIDSSYFSKDLGYAPPPPSEPSMLNADSEDTCAGSFPDNDIV